MAALRSRTRSRLAVALIAAAIGAAAPGSMQGAAANDRFRVVEQDVVDLKSVFATVRSKDRIEARVRTPGTVVTLRVDEGAHVEPGQVLALIADPKIAKGSFGFDASRNEYVDLVEAGIIDPTKVVRVALGNAVSVASVLLLTEATKAELPEEKPEAAGSHEMAM